MNDHPNGMLEIVKCDNNLYHAYITRFYCAGYYDNSENGVSVTSLCHSDYCSYNGSTVYSQRTGQNWTLVVTKIEMVQYMVSV